jgi:hypothetical protein
MLWPVCGSGQRAMSPAAKIPGALVWRFASTTIPRSIARPAFCARFRFGAEMEDDAVLFVHLADELSDLRAHHALERDRLRRDDVNFDAASAERRGDFEPDEARAHHDCTLRILAALDDRAAVGERSENAHVRQICAGDRKADGIGARRDEERIPSEIAPVLQKHALLRDLDRRDLRAELEIDHLRRVPLGRLEWDPLFERVSGEVVLREVRAIDGRRVIGAKQRDRAHEVFAPEAVGRGHSGSTGSDDHDFLRTAPRAPFGRANGGLARDVHAPVPLFDLEALQADERRRVQGFARPHVEARVVPWATNRFADHEPLGKRTAVMRACRCDREDLASFAHENDPFAVAVPEERLSFDDVGLGDASLQIRSFQFCRLAHQVSPTIFSGRTH